MLKLQKTFKIFSYIKLIYKNMTKPRKTTTRKVNQNGGFIFSLSALIAGAIAASKAVAVGASMEAGRQVVKKMSGDGKLKRPRKRHNGGTVFPQGMRSY
jgi:hypothetical protein